MRPRDAIYTTLKRRIVLNELRPGVTLTELAVAADLGSSQGPVREALMRLQEDGLVLRSGHRGTSVTPLNPEEAEEILALRRRIEVRAAPRAVRAVDAAALARLTHLRERMDAAAEAGDEYGLIELDTEFHLSIFRLAELRALEQILVRCILHSHRQKLWEPRHRRPLVETAARHDGLLELVKARDGEALARAIGDHIDTIVEVQAQKGGVMTVEIDPDMLPILTAMRAAPPVDYAAMPIDLAREVFEQGMAPWSALGPQNLLVEDLTVAGAAGPLRARLFRPTREKLPLILFIHGGGWTFGSVDSHQNEMRFLALKSGCAVLGFDYRLGPEMPFPAPLEDVLAVVEAVRAGALGDRADAGRLALAGDSAGATLALGALLALRDAGKPMPVAAGLFYGCFAPAFETESHRQFGDGSFGLSTERMRWYWGNFLGGAASPTVLAAPLDADLDGLPPLYLIAAGLDCLRDDTLALAERLGAIGAEHEIAVVPGVIHGFLGRAPRLPVAQSALAEAGVFLAAKLKP